MIEQQGIQSLLSLFYNYIKARIRGLVTDITIQHFLTTHHQFFLKERIQSLTAMTNVAQP